MIQKKQLDEYIRQKLTWTKQIIGRTQILSPLNWSYQIHLQSKFNIAYYLNLNIWKYVAAQPTASK